MPDPYIGAAFYFISSQLLLMKRGGCVIYGGKLGTHSQTLIDYFQVKKNCLTLYGSFSVSLYVEVYSPMFIYEVSVGLYHFPPPNLG